MGEVITLLSDVAVVVVAVVVWIDDVEQDEHDGDILGAGALFNAGWLWCVTSVDVGGWDKDERISAVRCRLDDVSEDDDEGLRSRLIGDLVGGCLRSVSHMCVAMIGCGWWYTAARRNCSAVARRPLRFRWMEHPQNIQEGDGILNHYNTRITMKDHVSAAAECPQVWWIKYQWYH